MPLNQPLARLLDAPPDPGRAVAFGHSPDLGRTHADLLSDVSALARELAGDHGRRWLVESEDAYRIAVTLLAAAAVGARVALPPNLQPGTLEELGSACDRVFVDSTSRSSGAPRAPRAMDPLAPGAAAGGIATARPTIDRHAPLVELFTSGTSGPGKLVTKALCHLEDEVVELERALGSGLDTGDCVLATVSAHHLYGLLFRVLWPLAAGRATCRAGFLLPDELLARIAEAGRAIVVSSPAHLRHLAASPRLADHARAIRVVFSSGGPLEPRAALDIETATGAAPVEIFGSTETGGVAFRRAGEADPSPRWRLFAPVGISVSDDGRLVVASPFVTAPPGADAPSPGVWCMGDRVEMDGEGFRLLGRSDRVAKVGEKTLSLPEIEEHLAQHEFVETAVVGPYLEREVQRLGAIVVLSAAGRRRLAGEGRRALQRELAAHLATRWTRVALPRRWRFPDALPADARGKVAQESFEQEIARAASEPLEPLLVSQHRDGGHVVLELVVPRDLAYLAGHYDAFPLVPGVVQIHWVLVALGRILGRSVSAQRMEAVKFKNVLRPAQAFTMRLRLDEDGSRVDFTLADDTRVFSSGRVTLAA